MIFRVLLGCCVIVAVGLVVPARAASPVVVEFFGQNGCGHDLDIQKQLYEFVRTREDIIFVNCRTLHDVGEEELEAIKQRAMQDYGVKYYFHDFCTKRSKNYSLKNGEPFHGSFMVLVNGRWIANNYDIMPAINLGASEKLSRIDMARDAEVLHITVPDDKMLREKENGVLYLFAYAPSTGVDVGQPEDVPNNRAETKERVKRMLDGYRRLVPVEEEETRGEIDEAEALKEREKIVAARLRKNQESKVFFFRPIAAIEKIGVWDGSKAQYDVSLATISVEAGLGVEDMGYVVLMQEGDGVSTPVIAAGEIVPERERMEVPGE